ncbi:MAG: class I SAM-dependent methyltransferase [Marinilabiliales bacterium]|nr:MAG: class I SAM-dependent methyltransferase [Marinilabiliales bacterium]
MKIIFYAISVNFAIMFMKQMGKIKLLIRYFVYWLRRKGAKGHGIHSPFVYRFNFNILNSSGKYPEYAELTTYRQSLMANRQTIKVCDMGAGSRVFSSEHRRVCDIARLSGSSMQTGRMLFRLARSFPAPAIIELGTSLGFGTLCLAKGAPGGIVYSIEGCGGQLGVARSELGKREVGNVRLIEGSFTGKLPGVLDLVERADLVYFDGDHREESLLWQYKVCKAKAGQGTIFVIGDIHWSPGMEKAWKTICGDQDVSCTIDLFYSGLVLFREGMAKQHYLLRCSG